MSEFSQVTLVVTNTEQLDAGGSAVMSFDQQGGTIGADPSQQWVLRDRQGRIAPRHCLIHLLDDEFCITDVCGTTFMNGASMPIGYGRHARLNDNDVVGIGPYSIRVSFEHNSSLPVLHSGHNLDSLLEPQEGMAWEQDGDPQAMLEMDMPTIDDPLSALDELTASELTLEDYLQDQTVDDDDERRRYLSAEDQIWVGAPLLVQADNQRNDDAAIELKQDVMVHTRADRPVQPSIHPRSIEHPLDLLSDLPHEEQFQMNSQDLDPLDQIEQELGRVSEEQSAARESASVYSGFQQPDLQVEDDSEVNHMVTGPMLKGLGAHAGDPNDMGQMHALSEEMGASLRAAIQGLLELHQQVSESRYGLMNKNLQPIEDNPLRLGLSYDETIQTMFDAKRSMVHLSAPAAIEESLRTVKHHNEAVQTATTQALAQILRAFSPDVLMKRFHNYRRSNQPASVETDSWAWQMYRSYYQELTSNRQHGFEKLFWEIFDQSYDRELRLKQQEV
ncbi:type VI secretion system-associated FHA domain protein TagH [Celerinatantimonas sp. YJH-8]|uniref:type VI secretion system-associated FHA domain protein TagH n=1 Tax=Celerinatantimonas sp. YJH-8 TaxID=3228714 RepID=UPI0038CB0503